MAYDIAVPGYGNDTVNSLRLWAAKSSREFDLEKFNAGEYVEAVEDKTSSENISKVLYPPDDQYAGTRAAPQAAVLLHLRHDPGRHPPLPEAPRAATGTSCPDKVAIQLNDTHPAIAIPELMRVLVDQEALEWDAAWWLCAARVRVHEPHRAAGGAGDVAEGADGAAAAAPPADHRGDRPALPRGRSRVRIPATSAKMQRMAIVDDQAQTCAWPTWPSSASHSVNGVARAALARSSKSQIFPDFHRALPEEVQQQDERHHAAPLAAAGQPGAGRR